MPSNRKPEEVHTSQLMTPGQVAKQLNVSPVTVRHWARHGLLPSISTPGGHRRFLKHDVAAFVRTHYRGADQAPLRVLIVDGDPRFSGYLVDVLASLKNPIEWTIASDGYTAGLQTLLFRPDILLVDTDMAGLDSSTLARQLKKLSGVEKIRVIAMSHLSKEHDALVDAGVDAVLTKPFTKKVLLEELSKLTERDIVTGCL